MPVSIRLSSRLLFSFISFPGGAWEREETLWAIVRSADPNPAGLAAIFNRTLPWVPYFRGGGMLNDDVFLAKLLEGPADDTTRLVYADWLDEQGDSISTAKA